MMLRHDATEPLADIGAWSAAVVAAGDRQLQREPPVGLGSDACDMG